MAGAGPCGTPQLLQAVGLLILVIVSLLARQTALAVICLLALIAFVGWRLATYGWTPMETVRRTIEHGYGVAVVRLLNADDMNQPVRVITEGGQYVAWYTDGRESRIHTAILIVNKGRIALTGLAAQAPSFKTGVSRLFLIRCVGSVRIVSLWRVALPPRLRRSSCSSIASAGGV